MKVHRPWRRALRWLLFPALLGATLWAGSRLPPPVGETVLPPPPAVPQPDPVAAPPAQAARFAFERADGEPAAAARVFLLGDLPQGGRCDAAGHIRFLLTGGGPFQVLAWLPGHELLQSQPFSEAPAQPFRLRELAEPRLPRPVPEEETTRALILLSDAGGEPLAGALLLARAPGEAGPPWLALSGPSGGATLEGVPPGAIEVEVYAPGLPPEPPWLLDRHTLLDGVGQEEPWIWRVPGAWVRIERLPALAMLVGERLDPDAPLPLRVAGDDGELLLGPLPPGAYRFRLDDETSWLSAALAPGLNALAWPVPEPGG